MKYILLTLLIVLLIIFVVLLMSNKIAVGYSIGDLRSVFPEDNISHFGLMIGKGDPDSHENDSTKYDINEVSFYAVLGLGAKQYIFMIVFL